MLKKEKVIKNVTVFVAYLFIVWGFYRLIFKLPSEIEEIVIKPILWLLPLFYILKIEKRNIGSLGVTLRNIFPSIYLSISLGIAFAIEGLLINFLKYNRFEFEANIGDSPFLIILGLSFVTAISEEVVFRGYIFNRLLEIIKKEWTANIISSLIWGLIHLPITLFWWKMDIGSSMGYIILITIFGMGSAFVFARTRNVFSSILLHVLWGWPILLFR